MKLITDSFEAVRDSDSSLYARSMKKCLRSYPQDLIDVNVSTERLCLVQKINLRFL